MINQIIRNFIAKQLARRSDDGIMITLSDPKKVHFAENILMDLLMRNGIDPSAIQNETQLKNIINQIETQSANIIRNTDVSGIRGTRQADVFDMEGKKIPEGSRIMGGQAADDLPPPGSRGGPDDIAAPVQSSEETIKNMIEAENKKAVDNLKQKMAKEKARTQRISGNLRADNMNRYEIGKPKLDEDEYDYYREILDDDENFVVKGDETREQLDAMVKEQEDEMAYMKRLYDKGALDDPEKKADGGRIGFRVGSGEGKDTSGRDYASDTAASRSVATSPSRNTGGGGDNNNQPPQKIKLPEPVKSGIDTYNNLKYLQNLYKMNPQGILFDVGKQFLMNKLFTEADTQQDPNMMLAFEPGSIKDKQLKQMYNIFQETGMENPMMKDLMKEDIEQGGPLSLPKEAYQMAADGGRIGFFMGSKFPKGLGALREMLKFFSKGKDKERSGSEMLKLVNPKQFNKLLEDPNIYRKFDIQKGIGAPELIKNMQADLAKNRTMMVEEILGAAKNLRKADVDTMGRKNEIVKEMIERGIDRETAGEMADTILRMAEATAGMRSTPKLTDEGILELENILKNMKTGGKDKRSLNADGGRIGLKDGPKMTRRTFLKYLTGLAAIPIVGKIVKPLKTVKGVKNVPIVKTSDVAGKPEWFDQLVNKVIIEGDDVTKKFATKDREIVHTKKIDDNNDVTVYQDLDEGTIRVDYDSPSNMGEDTVSLQYKPGRMDESTGKKPKDEFEASELEPRYVGGPEDTDIEFDGLGGGSDIRMLESDISKLKEYATGQKQTLKEFIESKKRKDRVKAINEDTMEQAEYISGKYGDGPEPDFDDIEDFAKGGIARMLGE